jgi:hypothetical protein
MAAGCKGVVFGAVNGGLNIEPVVVDSCGHLVIGDQWSLLLRSDETANDSDKELTVPAGTEQQVLWLWVELATTATVGARQIVVEIQDAANDVVAQWVAGVTQAASLTYNYCFAPGNADLIAVRDSNYIMSPIPPTLVLPAGYGVRVYDNNAVDAAADDMVIQMMVAARAVC